MDRKQRLILHPTAAGWMGTRGAANEDALSRQEAPSLAEAAGVGAEGGPVTLALPSRLAVFERMTLPSLEAAELSEMVRLQFEKILPHPVEEMGFGWQMLCQAGSETTLFACAVHEPELAALFAPLGVPGLSCHITLWAMHVAAQACGTEPACGVWREGGEVVFGIFQARRLAYLELIRDPLADIPRVLISAAIAGAPIQFEKLFVDPALADCAARISALVGAPAAEWTANGLGQIPGEAVDFLPEKWRARVFERARARRRWRGVGVAAGLYVAILIATGVLLTVGQRRLVALEREIAALHPSVDGLIERQARWNALAAAVDPGRYPVELLYQISEAFSTPDLRLTRFELTAQEQLLIEGEAANARQAIAFAENLKSRPGLSRYRFESGPPVLLSNEHAQFRIYGKAN